MTGSSGDNRKKRFSEIDAVAKLMDKDLSVKGLLNIEGHRSDKTIPEDWCFTLSQHAEKAESGERG